MGFEQDPNRFLLEFAWDLEAMKVIIGNEGRVFNFGEHGQKFFPGLRRYAATADNLTLHAVLANTLP